MMTKMADYRRRDAIRATSALAAVEITDDDRIDALESELRLLTPYASTKGLVALRARVDEIREAVHRLRGLKLEDADGDI